MNKISTYMTDTVMIYLFLVLPVVIALAVMFIISMSGREK